MARRGFDPVYDLGEVLLLDLAEAQILGGEAISDFQGLRHLGPVIGPVPSTPTVWRALSEVGELQLGRVNAAVTEFRRHWWVLLTQHPEGFPWLKVAGRELCGVTVVELDASIVFASSEKENVQPTYKGGVGFCGEPGHLRQHLMTCWRSTRGRERDLELRRGQHRAAGPGGVPAARAVPESAAGAPRRGRVLPPSARTHRRQRRHPGPVLGVLACAGHAPTPRPTPSRACPPARGPRGSTRTMTSCPTPSSPR